MNKVFQRLALVGVGLFFSQGLSAQFQKVIGTSDGDHPTSLIPSSVSSDWIITAKTYSTATGNDGFVTSINANGNVNWSNRFNDPTNTHNELNDAIFMPNGDLFVSGTDGTMNAQGAVILQLDPATGSTINQMKLSTPGLVADYGENLILDAAGTNLVLTGRSGGSPHITRVNTGLTTTQSIIYDDFHGHYGYDIVTNNNVGALDGYVVAGNQFTSLGMRDGLVMNVRANGTIIWQKTYDINPNGDEEFRSINKLSNGGGYVLTGYTNSTGAGQRDVLLVVLDNSGNVQYASTFGGTNSEEGVTAIQTADGGFAILGETYSFGHGQSDLYLIKIDAAGLLEWSMAYGGADNDYCTDDYNPLYELPNGDYMFAGTTTSFGAGDPDIYLIRTDWTGSSGCHELGALTVQSSPFVQTTNSNLAAVGSLAPVTPVLTETTPNVYSDYLCCGVWHQTSANNFDHDSGNDIVTDGDGNVYVTGTYDLYTHFQGTAVPSSLANADEAMFIAKYSACGNLDWVAYSENSNSAEITTGKGVVLDEVEEVVYVTGAYVGTNNLFYNAGGGGTPVPLTAASPAIGMYVASFNMSDGSVNWVHEYNNAGAELDPVAIAIDPDQELFVAGTMDNGSTTNAFLFKMTAIPSQSSDYFVTGSNNSAATDIAARGVGQRLYITGNYAGTSMQMGNSNTVPNNGTSDGFLASLNDAGSSANFAAMTHSGSYSGGWSQVNAVTVDPYGFPCVVGNFSGKMDGYFVWPIQLNGALGTGSGSEMFVARVDPTGAWGTGSWIKASNGTSYTYGRDISHDGTDLIALGAYDKSISFAPSISLTHTNSGTQHMFLSRFELATGNSMWALEAALDEQNPTRLSVDDLGYIFSTGSYTGQMDMQNGDVPLLTNTSSGTGGNCFIVRADATIGDFFFVDPDFNSTGFDEEQEVGFAVYPNPSNGLAYISLPETASRITLSVYNELQQLVKVVQVNAEANETFLDLSNESPGVYFIQMENDGSIETTKLILSR